MNIANPHRFGGATFYDSGNALRFDGINNVVTFQEAPDYGTWRASFWVKWDGSQNSMVFGSSSGLRWIGLLRSIATNTIQVRAALVNTFLFPSSIGDNNWHHILISNDKVVGMHCYKDGEESTSGLLTAANGEALKPRIIGKRTTDSYFKGAIDDCYFSEGTATLQNAIDIHANGYGADPSVVFSAGGFIFYKLNESGLDAIALDSSGNGRNGKLTDFSFSPSPWEIHEV